MDASLAELVAQLKQFGPAAVTTGMFVWYLARRDAKTGPTVPSEQVEQAILEIARQAPIQTKLLEKCVDGHGDTKVVLTRVETKLDMRNGQASRH